MNELIKIEGENVVTNELHEAINVFEALENKCSINDFMEWYEMIPSSKQCELFSYIEKNNLMQFFDKNTLHKHLLNGCLTSLIFIANKSKSVEMCDFDVVKIKDDYYIEVDKSIMLNLLGIYYLFGSDFFSNLEDKVLININKILFVQTLLDDILSKKHKKKPIKVKEQKTYVMIDRSTGFYKIGRSLRPIKRERTLQSEKPTIELLLIFDGDIERILHKEYKEKRVRGEWFNLSADNLLDLIENHGFKKNV